jgi:hypothetical protein
MPLVTRMVELQVNMRGIQLHHRVCKFLPKGRTVHLKSAACRILFQIHSGTIPVDHFYVDCPIAPPQSWLRLRPLRRLSASNRLIQCAWQSFDTIYGGNGGRWLTPERNAIGHTRVHFKRTCVGSKSILECKIPVENSAPNVPGIGSTPPGC